MAALMLAALGSATPAEARDTAITAGAVVQGQLERGDTRGTGRDRFYLIDTYIYEGQAGEELTIVVNRPGSNGYPAHARIRGPGNFVSEHRSGGVNIRLSTTGRYRIDVLDTREDNPIPYELRVWRINPTPNPSTLTIGTLVSASLSLGDNLRERRWPYDVYTFTAAAGEVIGVRLRSDVDGMRGSSDQTRFEIRGPNFGSYDSGEAPTDKYYYFHTAGEHQIQVSTFSGLNRNYSIELVRGRSAASVEPDGAIALGQSVEVTPRPDVINADALLNNNAVGIYTLEARQGDRIAIVTRWSASVYGPNGQQLRGEHASGGSESASVSSLTVQMPESGQYRIVATAGPLSVVSPEQGASAVAQARAVQAMAESERQARIAQLIERGNQLLNSGANQEAYSAFYEADWLSNYSNTQAIMGVGVAQYRMGQHGSAVYFFQRVLEKEPNNQLARTTLAAAQAQEAARQRRYDEVNRAYQAQRAREKQENANAVSNALGIALGAYNVTTQVQQQQSAQAAAQARAQADAQAAANARAAQQAAAQAQARANQQSATSPPPVPVTLRGENQCAEIRGTRIFNKCRQAIWVVLQYAPSPTHPQGSRGEAFVAGHNPDLGSSPQSERLGYATGIVRSCYFTVRSGDDWICN